MENIVTCTLRINEKSWEKLKEIAQKNKRSINKEIEYIIDKRIEEFVRVDKEKRVSNLK